MWRLRLSVSYWSYYGGMILIFLRALQAPAWSYRSPALDSTIWKLWKVNALPFRRLTSFTGLIFHRNRSQPCPEQSSNLLSSNGAESNTILLTLLILFLIACSVLLIPIIIAATPLTWLVLQPILYPFPWLFVKQIMRRHRSSAVDLLML